MCERVFDVHEFGRSSKNIVNEKSFEMAGVYAKNYPEVLNPEILCTVSKVLGLVGKFEKIILSIYKEKGWGERNESVEI